MKEKIRTKVIVDCSHGNSGKIHTNQPIVLETLMAQYDNGEDVVAGVMIESNLKEGNQKLKSGCKLEDLEYGKSITDACVGLKDTTKMLKRMANSHNKRNPKKQKLDHSYEVSDFKDMIRC